MAVFSYSTIDKPAAGLYKEKGSKFISFAFPVETEEELQERLSDLKKKYFDAQHHCYAWFLGPEKKNFRAFDDGEPRHSAGDPILGQIRSKNLTNVMVVVVRYFGGTKLGVGGLIGAYKNAAEDALRNATVIEKKVHFSFTIRFDYLSTPEVMKLIKEFGLTVLHQDFTDNCRMKLEAVLRDQDRIMEKIALLNATGTTLVFAND